MIKLYDGGVFLREGAEIVPEAEAAARGISKMPDEARRGTIAYSILQAHNTSGDPSALKIRFDAMASHDITFVGIIQTARASGMTEFPLPYVLTNCHNSLCVPQYPIYQEMIPDRVCVADARNKQVSIIEYAPESEAARAYQVVCDSFVKEVEYHGIHTA